MVIFKKIEDLKKYINDTSTNESKTGFIPTMGALHSGHLSLIENAHAHGHITICSIFLNPTQFNNRSDFENYPTSIDADIELLTKAKCDVLFLPDEKEIYPDGPSSVASFDFGFLDTILEGKLRPGHFKGVGQVVGRLLDIVEPDYLYLGQKDFQQCKVIQELIKIRVKANKKNTKIIICSTTRDADGLAMSSRNRRLTEPQRNLANIIYQCLISIQTKQNSAHFNIVEKECFDLLTAKGFKPEYIALADSRDLRILDDYEPTTPMIALIAAWIGNVRLIDNMLL